MPQLKAVIAQQLVVALGEISQGNLESSRVLRRNKALILAKERCAKIVRDGSDNMMGTTEKLCQAKESNP